MDSDNANPSFLHAGVPLRLPETPKQDPSPSGMALDGEKIIVERVHMRPFNHHFGRTNQPELSLIERHKLKLPVAKGIRNDPEMALMHGIPSFQELTHGLTASLLPVFPRQLPSFASLMRTVKESQSWFGDNQSLMAEETVVSLTTDSVLSSPATDVRKHPPIPGRSNRRGRPPIAQSIRNRTPTGK